MYSDRSWQHVYRQTSFNQWPITGNSNLDSYYSNYLLLCNKPPQNLVTKSNHLIMLTNVGNQEIGLDLAGCCFCWILLGHSCGYSYQIAQLGLDSLRCPSSYVWQWVLPVRWASQYGHSSSRSLILKAWYISDGGRRVPWSKRWQPHITRILQASVCVTFTNIPMSKAR